MTIVIDECLPKRMVHLFGGHTVWTVPRMGLAGYNDGDLLSELDRRQIDLFVTIDGNMEYQQQFSDRGFCTVVIRSVSNRFSDLELLKEDLLRIVKNAKPGTVIHLP